MARSIDFVDKWVSWVNAEIEPITQKILGGKISPSDYHVECARRAELLRAKYKLMELLKEYER